MYASKNTQRRLKNEAKKQDSVSRRIPLNPELPNASKEAFKRKPFHVTKKG